MLKKNKEEQNLSRRGNEAGEAIQVMASAVTEEEEEAAEGTRRSAYRAGRQTEEGGRVGRRFPLCAIKQTQPRG